MSNDITDSIELMITLAILGGVMITFGFFFNSPILGVVGVIFAGALPALAIIMAVVKEL